MWAAIANVVIGLWLMIAPAYFSFEKAAANNHYITGPLVVTMAIVSIWEFNRALRYFNLVAGVWLVVAPFMLYGHGGRSQWNSIICGILLIIFSSFKGKIEGRYGGGWSALFSKH